MTTKGSNNTQEAEDNYKDTIYNSSNVLHFIDAISPLPSASEKRVKSQIVASMFPELFVIMDKPVEPRKPDAVVDPSKLVTRLSDSANYYNDDDDRELDEELLRKHFSVQKDYDLECDLYNRKKKEYDDFQKRKKTLFVSAKKYMEGNISWGAILDYYKTSTYLKYIIETQAVLIGRYVKKIAKTDSIHVKNFKKAVPQMVEFYHLFGKCSLCFSKVVKDEVEVLDPMQLVNTQMLLPATLSHAFFGEGAYETYRNLGWRDWDPVNYVDVMTLPSLQTSKTSEAVKSPEDIRKEYSTLASTYTLSHRFHLEQTIPVVGRKSIMQEKLSLLGGDATFVADNLWHLATAELFQNIFVVTAKNLNTFHVKDPSLGLDSVFENGYDMERESIQGSMAEVTDEGDMAMFTTSSNAELRVNTIPADHLQEMLTMIIRQLFSRMGMDTPERVSSSEKGTKKSSYKQEYWILNVGTFVWEKYCKMLAFAKKISEEERDKMLQEGVFSKYPRIDLRDPDEINGQKAIFDSLAVAGNATIESKSYLAEQLFDLDVKFEKEEKTPAVGASSSAKPKPKTDNTKKGTK